MIAIASPRIEVEHGVTPRTGFEDENVAAITSSQVVVADAAFHQVVAAITAGE